MKCLEVVSKLVGVTVPDSRILIFKVCDRPSYFCKAVLKPALVIVGYSQEYRLR